MAKKKDKAITDPRRAEYERNVTELGMKRELAAIAAGYNSKEAGDIVAAELLKDVYSGRDFKDVGELQGITPALMIKHLATRAGFFDREEGAKKVVSVLPKIKMLLHGKITKPLIESGDNDAQPANEQIWDWVEVPDDGTQLKYMNLLLEFLQYTGQAKPGAVVPIGGGSKTIELHFHVLPEQGKQIAQAAVQAHTNGNGAHLNGNGSHFTVVDT